MSPRVVISVVLVSLALLAATPTAPASIEGARK
jgi:hypothetical protein